MSLADKIKSAQDALVADKDQLVTLTKSFEEEGEEVSVESN